MAIQLTKTTVQYDNQRPVRETIRATGRLAVTGVSVACETAELTRDVVILARATLQESLIEAQVDAKAAELEGLDKLADLEAKLEAKRIELAKA
jgi:hypothetical protein